MYQAHLVDIPADEIAVLSPITTMNQTVQLVAGGNATITIPVLDGISFRAVVAGHAFISAGADATISVMLNGHQIGVADVTASGGSRPFLIDARCVWDSTTNRILIQFQSVGLDGSFTPIIDSAAQQASLTSPSDFEITLFAGISGTDNSSTLTITEFRILPS